MEKTMKYRISKLKDSHKFVLKKCESYSWSYVEKFGSLEIAIHHVNNVIKNTAEITDCEINFEVKDE